METVCVFEAVGFEKDLQAGIHVGYSGTYIEPDTIPNVFNGAAVGLQLVYGLTETVGLTWEGAFDWHGDYRNYHKEEVLNEDGEPAMDWVSGAKVDHYFVSTTALSVMYTIDITRVVPYLSAGAVGSRVDRKIDGVEETNYGFGLRLGGGFDYLFNRVAVGAGIISDRYYVGDTDHNRRILFFLRFSAVFHFKAESLAAKKSSDSIRP